MMVSMTPSNFRWILSVWFDVPGKGDAGEYNFAHLFSTEVGKVIESDLMFKFALDNIAQDASRAGHLPEILLNPGR